MAAQTIPFQTIESITERLKELGCEIRTVKGGNLIGPDGEAIVVNYFYNPKNENWYFNYFADGETVTGSMMEGIERTLGIDLGFPKLPPYHPSQVSTARH